MKRNGFYMLGYEYVTSYTPSRIGWESLIGGELDHKVSRGGHYIFYLTSS